MAFPIIIGAHNLASLFRMFGTTIFSICDVYVLNVFNLRCYVFISYVGNVILFNLSCYLSFSFI